MLCFLVSCQDSVYQLIQFCDIFLGELDQRSCLFGSEFLLYWLTEFPDYNTDDIFVTLKKLILEIEKLLRKAM